MKIQRGSRLSAQFHKPVPLFESEEISRPSKGNEKWKRSNLISSILKLACWRESVSASVLSYRLCCPSLLCPCGAQSRRHGDRWRVRDTCPLSLPLCPPPPTLVSHSIDKGFVDLHYWKGEWTVKPWNVLPYYTRDGSRGRALREKWRNRYLVSCNILVPGVREIAFVSNLSLYPRCIINFFSVLKHKIILLSRVKVIVNCNWNIKG